RGTTRRYRARAHPHEEVRGAARRSNLGRERGGQGLNLYVHAAGAILVRSLSGGRPGMGGGPLSIGPSALGGGGTLSTRATWLVAPACGSGGSEEAAPLRGLDGRMGDLH